MKLIHWFGAWLIITGEVVYTFPYWQTIRPGA